MAKGKKIKKPKIKNSIPDPKLGTVIKKPSIPTNNGFSLYSVYPWIQGTKKFLKRENFTNLCRCKDDFADEMCLLFNVIIPKLYQDSDNIFNFGNKWLYPHCHTLTGEKLNLAIKIANEIHQREFDTFEGDSISWWQVGMTQGVRIIGLYNKPQNCFYPIFIDRHHLLYPDNNYNQADFEMYDYNPTYR